MLLAIDTCGTTGTLALGRLAETDLKILGSAELPAKQNSSELIPQLRHMLAAGGASLAEVTAIVVVSGPGSFTGGRIGISTAKGLAAALDKPIVAVSRLAVLAAKAGTRSAVLDAGRGEFYRGEYSDGTASEMLLTAEQAVERAAMYGDPPAVCEPSVYAAFPRAVMVSSPAAADALHFALPRILAVNYDDADMLDANYLRRSDAELFLKTPQAG
ncbi:tRNA (adenosine(37)-N6)-threonylcarbamoyltransferase complex dimerization subunit type 1 TsaB [Paracidobacterium acidisoli]|uniref:tRNA (Adenosine(37)-N6)-threonylcarbamoyltransferase complex dimerization subunit type 1 TsaB n=1 Tax=Paracidobacterium acidisoli TaxID=2303751 RepID=A0A372ISZ2_9BACT|nr:tRNA (adenosine(37)-N6)-threonylcarbamoyltransferase complex dimerization subunit type 1 TsaB [Paracidobacterium acidisoli]MBT9329428.1 tRNA (adenosine(37)-N6)-threonylcarbamoyltransferase complex dimerization subunit type 1 TsaB [Paracidobacterium acidisoli]